MIKGVDYPGVCTVFYCHDGQGNWVFHKRSKNTRDEHGAWDTGSGSLEFGLTLEENVLKEVQEEYGCRGIIEEQLAATAVMREWQGNQTHWIAIPFIVRVNPKEVRIGEPEAMDEIGWFALDNLPQPLHTGFAGMLPAYRIHLERYSKKN